MFDYFGEGSENTVILKREIVLLAEITFLRSASYTIKESFIVYMNYDISFFFWSESQDSIKSRHNSFNHSKLYILKERKKLAFVFFSPLNEEKKIQNILAYSYMTSMQHKKNIKK